MRIFRSFFILFLIVLCSLFFSMNSQIINIRILPGEFDSQFDMLSTPVYIVIIVCVTFGWFLGIIFEHSRTRKYRRVSRRRLLEVTKLEAKLNNLTSDKNSETDEILGLLK